VILPNATRLVTLFILISAFPILVAGCGDDGSSGQSGSPAAGQEGPLEVPPPQSEAEERAQAKALEGVSPMLRAIHRQFPAPRPNPKVKGSAEAIATGEEACAGKTPLEVREEFVPESDLSDFLREQVERIPDYERNPSYSFPAGQLAASVYETTLPPTDQAAYSFQGCVYALAKVLEAELASKE
jgi:hypothetical protein